MKRILFICHGNICRSPMAEFILKYLTAGREDFEIDSAAVSREEIGNDLYPPAKACLRAHGIPLARHSARQVTPDDYARFDKLILMDRSNLSLIRGIIPSDPEGKICRLLDFTDEPHDISDPWYTGDFEKSYSEILRGAQALLESLK